MATYREDPAAYMRAYRARKLGEPVVDKARDRALIVRAERANLKAQRDYEAPGGRGATAGQVIAAGERAAARVMAEVTPTPAFRPPAVKPPASMQAIGGKGGKGRAVAGYDPQRAPLGSEAIEIGVSAVLMNGALRSENAALKRQLAQSKAREAAREAERKAKGDRVFGSVMAALRTALGAGA
jgi:hypothetical protein